MLYCIYNMLTFVNLRAFDPTTYFLLLQLRVVVTGVMFQVSGPRPHGVCEEVRQWRGREGWGAPRACVCERGIDEWYAGMTI